MGSEVTPSGAPRLRAEGLSKTFGPARVLRDAQLEIRPGEVHALVGANGSGKSTLIKCITGVQAADRGGLLEIDGQVVGGDYSTTIAHELGVRVVHQEAPLIESLTLAETVGHNRGFPTRAGIIRTRQLNETTSALFRQLGMDLDPRLPAGLLSPPERAMVMLALALGDGEGRLIVLDEPTAPLTAGDAARFLASVRSVADAGAGVLLVTHRLAEIPEICDTVSVLRDGAMVFRAPVTDTDRGKIVDEIVGPTATRKTVGGSGAPDRFRPDAGPRAGVDGAAVLPPALEASDLVGDQVDGISLQAGPGEILGFSGLLGSGADELCALLAGAVAARSGAVKVHGNPLPAGFGTRTAIAAGVSYVPGDRLREGGIGSLSSIDNLALPNLSYYGLSPSRRNADFAAVVAALDVRPPSPTATFGTLSGGNQQKVIVGKWALMRPSVFLLDNPTAGVDPGAREDILRLLRGLAEAGTAVVIHSSEPEELARIATRVLVIRAGRVAAELQGRQLSERAITAAN